MTPLASMLDRVDDYLATRRALGFLLRVEGDELRRFARFVDDTGHLGPVTFALAHRWATLPEGCDRRYWARRLDLVRRFAQFRVPLDVGTEVPPRGILGASYRRVEPHIFTVEELAQLMRAAAKMPTRWPLRPHTYVALLGLLAATGLRISEALRLTRNDVDLVTDVLTVRETKFHGTRLVPIHTSVAQALRDYADRRDKRRPRPASDTFFLSEHGTSLKYCKVRKTFADLRQTLPRTSSPGRWPPRIHDLRHSFAVTRLLRWYEDGSDVGNKIISLSTYLGHAKVTDTYWYLTACPALLAVAAARFERHAESCKVAP